jgi:hypothetical protein
VTFCIGLNWPSPGDYLSNSLKGMLITLLTNVRPDFFNMGSKENFAFSLIVSVKAIIFSGDNE